MTHDTCTYDTYDTSVEAVSIKSLGFSFIQAESVFKQPCL